MIQVSKSKHLNNQFNYFFPLLKTYFVWVNAFFMLQKRSFYLIVLNESLLVDWFWWNLSQYYYYYFILFFVLIFLCFWFLREFKITCFQVSAIKFSFLTYLELPNSNQTWHRALKIYIRGHAYVNRKASPLL